jgi:cytochrome P450
MEPFFPAPNLLMEDGPAHVEHKKVWRSKVKGLPSESVLLIRQMTQTHLIEPLRQQTQGSDLDLYDTLKRFSWDLLLGVFLGLDRRTDQAAFDQVETIQETVLQGQFSLFPVSVRMPFWSSARSRGLDGVRQLDPILNRHWDRMTAAADDSDPSTSRCPFLTTTASDDGTATDIDTASGASHLRLFTSSISNKAVASLLTAFFLNLFLWKCDGSTPQQHSLAEMIQRQSDPITRHSMLRSVLKETERLSPPVVGVMRRVQRDVSLPTDSENPGHFVPAGHDVWLYLVGANRDEAVFPRANEFVWDRFMNSDSSTSHGLTFGQGEKQCLGLSIVEDMCVEVASTVIEHNLGIAGAITERGVRQWLGWESGSDLAAIARDMKQLPCQRPRKPVLVEVVNITD